MSLSIQDLARELGEIAGGNAAALPPQSPPEVAATGEGLPAPAPTVPPPPVQVVEYAAKGYHLDATVPADRVVAAAVLLEKQGFAMDAITGVDWMAQNEMEVVYDYFHPAVSMRVVVRCRVPRGAPEVPTISHVFAGANWHERETHEFFGIRFVGHPNLVPLLLPEDAEYHPLRKDFVA